MLRSGNALSSGESLRADLCVVGAGPAGLTVARGLAAGGASVVVLESGAVGYTKSLRKPWQVLRQHTRGAQSLAGGTRRGQPYTPLRFARARAFGGSTNALLSSGLQTRPLDSIDFEARSAVSHSRWPIDVEALAPHLGRAQALCGLSPAPYDPAGALANAGQAGLPFADGDLETALFRYAPGGHVASTVEEFRLAERVEVLTDATAVALETRGTDRVESVRARTLKGVEFRIVAPTVVLAAGALENARLLLASNDHDPCGIGNEHDLVGRYFMEHLQVSIGRWHATPDALVELPFYAPHRPPRDRDELTGQIRIRDEALRRHGLMNAAFEVFPMRPTATSVGWQSANLVRRAIRHKNLVNGTWRAAAAAVRHAPDIVSNLRARSSGAEASVVMVETMAEQEPNPESRVRLGPQRDRLGVPRTRLDWRLTPRDFDSIRRSAEVLGAALEEAGLGSFESTLDDRDDRIPVFGNWHHMGTTRMHDDPDRGSWIPAAGCTA